MAESVRVLSLGCGVQSTLLYLLGMELAPGFEFDHAVFADPGDEPAPVYRHLKWLQSLKGPPILVRSLGVKLGDQLMKGMNGSGQRFVSIPCYTKGQADESEGRTRRQCTREFKTDVVERTIKRDILGLKPRQRVPKGVLVTQIMGISFDERHRAGRIYNRFKHLYWSKPEFPLIDKAITRAGCKLLLAGRVPHEVPRSACVYCPFRGNEEWRWLQEHDQAGWQRAVEIDAALRVEGTVCNRKMDKAMYVHRSCVPLPMVDFSEKETIDMFSARDCQGYCGN